MTLVLFGILLALVAIVGMLCGIQGALNSIACELKRYNDADAADREVWSKLPAVDEDSEEFEKQLDEWRKEH